MRKIPIDEYNARGHGSIMNTVKPIVIRAKKMFEEDPDLKVLELERDDFPEELRDRFDNAPELQKLAGHVRMCISPLDNLSASVRKGRLYILRRQQPKKVKR